MDMPVVGNGSDREVEHPPLVTGAEPASHVARLDDEITSLLNAPAEIAIRTF